MWVPWFYFISVDTWRDRENIMALRKELFVVFTDAMPRNASALAKPLDGCHRAELDESRPHVHVVPKLVRSEASSS